MSARFFIPFPLLLLTFALLAAAPALAQDATMKVCGEKWQAAKAAGSTGGATWPKFLADCRAGQASGPDVPTTGAPVPAPVAQLPAASPPARGETVSKPAIFPDAVAAKYADMTPSQARRKTCSDQFQSNKAGDANGGLRWMEKGGGYWGQCNNRLKG
jgi:hypothetical protein